MGRLAIPVRILGIILLGIFDVYALRAYYRENDKLPFNFSPRVQEEITKILPPLPTPVPTPVPLRNLVEFSQTDWIGNIVYGKLTNHSSQTIVFPTLRFSLSKTESDLDVIQSYTATIAAKLEPNDSIYFSQRFSSVPKNEFWWSGVITDVESYTDQLIGKPPTGQQVSTKPISIPLTTAPAPKDDTPWGVAKQINDVTWTIKVGQDERMATPQETLIALNAYRQTHGSGPLTWDDNLAQLASERARYLNSIQTTDEHKGFIDYVANEDNVKKLGFWSVGENSGYGNKLLGVHLIEWVYAADDAHNKNQLEKSWSHVGIGISGLGVAFIFGGDKI